MHLQNQKIRTFSREEIQSKLQQKRSSSNETKYQQARDIGDILLEEYYLTKEELGTVSKESSIFKNYVITGKVGTGRFGVVYRGIQTNLGNRCVVIKLIQPKTLKHMELFDRQVKALGRLQHSNIITAIESGKIKNVCYLILEYFHGTQLDQYVKGIGPLTEEGTLEIAHNLTSALKHIWSKNLIHRDISPSNIMIGKRKVKLCDFNLIRAIESNRGHTYGIPIRSYDYSAPELAREGKLSFTCDCFSLGAILYFCVSGYSPFENPNERNIRRRSPYPLGKVAPKISKPLEKFITRLLSNTPEERAKSPESLLLEINSLIKRNKKKSLINAILIISAAFILLAYAFIPTVQNFVTGKKLTNKENMGEEIYKKRVNCVVTVEVGKFLGSGIIIKYKSKTLVVTNAHVITNKKSENQATKNASQNQSKSEQEYNKDKVKISLINGSSYNLNILNIYQNIENTTAKSTNQTDIDIAILDFSNNPHTNNVMPVTTENKVGQIVYTIGHPKGYKWSITQGTVSAVRGSIIQTDAPINPGNSGGPLIDENGMMIGMNTYVIDKANSIGFALSVEKIWEYLQKCEQKGLFHP